jgi:hypothetical protein
VSKPTSTKGVPSPLSHFSSAAQAFEDAMSTQDRTPRSTRYVFNQCEYIVQKHVSFIDASPEAASFKSVDVQSGAYVPRLSVQSGSTLSRPTGGALGRQEGAGGHGTTDAGSTGGRG